MASDRLDNLICYGTVTAVDKANRLARVSLKDKGITTKWIKVLATPPVVKILTDVAHGVPGCDIGPGGTSIAISKDNIDEESKKPTIADDTGAAMDEPLDFDFDPGNDYKHRHRWGHKTVHQITVTPWMPAVGDDVAVAFIANGQGDGFVLGGVQ